MKTIIQNENCDVKQKRKSPEELLRDGMVIDIPVNGWSMYPMFVPGRDRAVLTPFQETVGEGTEPTFPSAGHIKRGDVVLFRRKTRQLVLHRVFRVRGCMYWFVGDNMPDIERDIRREQLIGLLTGFVRNGKSHETSELSYRVLAEIWLSLRPLRGVIHSISRLVRKLRHNP